MSFLTNLNWRYATKKFDPTRKVSDADIDTILDAIRLAPTSFGLMPYNVYVVTNQETKDKIQAAAWNQPQVGTASHLLVFTARSDLLKNTDEYFTLMSGGNAEIRANMKGYEDMVTGFAQSKDENSALVWAAKQAYIAHGFALAACAELEIDSCAMEGFNPQAVGEILGLPANQKAVVMLPVGYRAEGEAPRGPKVRFPKETLFTWVK